jgi:hypothetical protein
MAGPAAVDIGKDIWMALLFCKLSFYRTAILLWLSVSLAGQLLSHPPPVSAAAASSPPSGATTADGGPQEPRSLPRLQRNDGSLPPLSQEQKRNILKANFQKMKRDADELANLAKVLQEELNKSNENILSVDIIDKADKIEKLAKKIKGSARGL